MFLKDVFSGIIKRYMKNKVAILMFLVTSIPSLSFAHTDHASVGERVDCAVITKTLKLGSRDSRPGEDVFVLQTYLAQAHFLEANPTGFFGKSTLKALLAFQSANNLDKVGIVGQRTRMKIKEISCTEVKQGLNDSSRKQIPLYLQN